MSNELGLAKEQIVEAHASVAEALQQIKRYLQQVDHRSDESVRMMAVVVNAPFGAAAAVAELSVVVESLRRASSFLGTA